MHINVQWVESKLAGGPGEALGWNQGLSTIYGHCFDLE